MTDDFRNSQRYIHSTPESFAPKTAGARAGDPSVPWLDDGDVRLYLGDNLDVLRALPDRSVHMCATSPPFYGLRDYGTGLWDGGDPDCDHREIHPQNRDGRETPGGRGGSFPTTERAYKTVCGKCGARRVDQQIGLEDTPDQWVERLVAVFREVRRVLRDDGTLWVEIGDSYSVQHQGRRDHGTGDPTSRLGPKQDGIPGGTVVDASPNRLVTGMKPKDLLGQPWLLAFALRADGWYLRSEIIWARPNPMPESVTDRPTKSHSTVFLLSKQPRYFFDSDAIREGFNAEAHAKAARAIARDDYVDPSNGSLAKPRDAFTQHRDYNPAGANARSVWTIPTQPTPFAHFATWPEALVRRMILAGTSERGCCPECGAPWTRDTETTFDGAITRGANEKYPERKATAHNPALAMGRATPSTRTLGWSPSCTCREGVSGRGRTVEGQPTDASPAPRPLTPVPCTVLDPFAGSATTMLVARNHGRHSIGIELNEEYLTIAAKRLQQLSLLSC